MHLIFGLWLPHHQGEKYTRASPMQDIDFVISAFNFVRYSLDYPI